MTRLTKSTVKEYMPTAADKKLLLEIIETEKKWIAEKTGARDPLASIGEVQEVGDQSVASTSGIVC